MFRLTVTLCVLLALVGLLAPPLTADDKADAVKKELKALEGTWELVATVNDDLSEIVEKEMVRLTVKGDGFSLGGGGEGQVDLKGTIKFDPTESPKTVDLVVENGIAKSKPLIGIYELRGDELKVCMTEPDNARPLDFTAKKDSGRLMHIYKRAKK